MGGHCVSEKRRDRKQPLWPWGPGPGRGPSGLCRAGMLKLHGGHSPFPGGTGVPHPSPAQSRDASLPRTGAARLWAWGTRVVGTSFPGGDAGRGRHSPLATFPSMVKSGWGGSAFRASPAGAGQTRRAQGFLAPVWSTRLALLRRGLSCAEGHSACVPAGRGGSGPQPWSRPPRTHFSPPQPQEKRGPGHNCQALARFSVPLKQNAPPTGGAVRTTWHARSLAGGFARS